MITKRRKEKREILKALLELAIEIAGELVKITILRIVIVGLLTLTNKYMAIDLPTRTPRSPPLNKVRVVHKRIKRR